MNFKCTSTFGEGVRLNLMNVDKGGGQKTSFCVDIPFQMFYKKILNEHKKSILWNAR